ncbi:MAG: hypothetical protein AAB546_01270 [Patescibacteria group bacterium]
MIVEGFRGILMKNRENFLDRNPDYSSPEATAAVALDSYRENLANLFTSGKIKGMEKMYLDEIGRRAKLIQNSVAYERFGEYWDQVVRSFQLGKFDLESED